MGLYPVWLPLYIGRPTRVSPRTSSVSALFLSMTCRLLNIRSSVRLFADECVFYTPIDTATDSQKLQQDLDDLSLWKQKWKMSFNVSKCHIIHITKSRNLIQTIYTLNNLPLSTVNQSTYLCRELTSNLSWSLHINKITSKGSQSLGFLKRNIYSAKQTTKEAAYNTIVRPTQEYCSSVGSIPSKIYR